MLEIHAIMNSPVEEIFAFRTCCNSLAFDQNLEIHVKNVGEEAVVVPSYFDLEGMDHKKRIDTLIPHGHHHLKPGETMAFYCFMDEKEWDESHRLLFYDDKGNVYATDISGPKSLKRSG